ADQAIYSVERTVKEHGDKISEDERKDITEAKERLEAAMKTESVEIINQKIDDLMTASQKIAEVIYRQTAQSASGAAGGPSGQEEPQPEQQTTGTGDGRKEDAVDADFEVVDDKDKKK
ncbi:MAG: Hsp70 family protein, partial [candidate division Zixibacteria bacterium]|nr:Hsp70 family protein [candidate division Zixibacteria bacterium]